MSIDTIFCQTLLKEAHKAVKSFDDRINLRSRDYWVYDLGHDHWEFHGPDEFYWHGSAGNAYDARYHGWMAWLRSKGVVEE